MLLKGKRVIVFSPEFFGIEKAICSELMKEGASVLWFDERSVKSSYGRAINSFFPGLYKWKADKYYKSILNSIKDDFDYVLVVKSDQITKNTIALFRKKWPKVNLILYLWDSVHNIKGIMSKVSLYDKTLSFDPKDCAKYGFSFRPLFCDLENKPYQGTKEEFNYDICFYGTMYGDRFRIIREMREYCELKHLKFYSFCFIRGKIIGFLYWMISKEFRKLGMNSISFKPLDSNKIMQLVKTSKAILDANDIHQTGLTIRTIEAVVSEKKLITTNENIKEYDFYNPQNVCIVNRSQIHFDTSFLENDYKPISPEILTRYTANGWIKEVFN